MDADTNGRRVNGNALRGHIRTGSPAGGNDTVTIGSLEKDTGVKRQSHRGVSIDGHAVRKLNTSTDPRPVARSYPRVAV